MLLEGKATGVAIVGLTAVFAAFSSLPTMMQDLVLAAAAIAALKVIGGAARAFLLRAREVHEAVTSKLPERMEDVEAQLRAGEVEFAAIRATLQTFGATEAAAVRGAIEAARRPRSPRASDPGVRTGWRE